MMTRVLTRRIMEKPRMLQLTCDEFFHMAELGIFGERRVELIHGKMIVMPEMKNEHCLSLTKTQKWLDRLFGETAWVRPQMPLRLTERSAPLPDLAVVRGEPDAHTDTPTTAALVIEISDTTLAYDRGAKLRLCAQAGIQDYWILNLAERVLEIYRDPKPNAAHPKKARYLTSQALSESDKASPLAAPKAKIKVADLLPKKQPT